MTETDEKYISVRKKALSLLEYGDRTEWELRDKLKRAGYDDEETDDAIEYAYSFHYLDDERYALHYIESYHSARSRQRIRQDLLKKHVSEEIIDSAYEQTGYDDDMALRKACDKVLRGVGDVSELAYEDRQKLMAKLVRKGFRMEDVIRAFEDKVSDY